MVQALAFAELLAGGVLFLAGWKGYSPAQVVRGEAGEPVPLGGKAKPAKAESSSSASSGPLTGGYGGLLHTGSTAKLERKDQGRDVQLEPGATLSWDAPFRVVSVLADAAGFGPDYPVVEILGGPFKGRKLYWGHTDALLHPGPKVYPAGTPIARTSTTGHNAPPGWLELGYADSGTPGPWGQAVPF